MSDQKKEIAAQGNTSPAKKESKPDVASAASSNAVIDSAPTGQPPGRGGGGGGAIMGGRGRGGGSTRGRGGLPGSNRGHLSSSNSRGGRFGHGAPPGVRHDSPRGIRGGNRPTRGIERGNKPVGPAGGSGGGGGGNAGGGGGRFDRVAERLQSIQGPTTDLPPLPTHGAKFSGRSRLYVGNMPPDMSEEHLKEIMSQFGEVGEIFYNREKNFAFLRMATRFEAETAKRELDGFVKNGRALKVRFAPHQGAVKVANLGPWVSNELLFKSFSIFGDIERAIVFVDERGRSKGTGLVEFERKPSALEAVKRCEEGCFFLAASIRPVIAELDEETEDDDGMMEKMLPKRNQDYLYERETGPRFAEPGSFEFEYGAKWKALYEMKKQKMQALEREIKLEEDKLIAQMEFARYEHDTEKLREQLRQREASREQHKTQWEAREREMQDMIRAEQERRSREEEALMTRMRQQDANIRQRQQENSLFMQAQELNDMLDQQEADMQIARPGAGGNFGGGPPGFSRGGGGNFRPPPGDKGMMNQGFGGPGFNFDGPGGPGGPFGGGNFGVGPGGPGLFGNGGGRRWNDEGGMGPTNKRRRF